MAAANADRGRASILLAALGIDPTSFEAFLEWALCEHLVGVLSYAGTVRAEGFFTRPDAMKVFRDLLRIRTSRRWSHHDLEALFERVKAEHNHHFRDPIPYEEYLKL